MDGGGTATTLKYTPTWVVAVVCIVIVAISVFVGRLLYFAGKNLEGRSNKLDKKCLSKALQQIKEELMILGFISLLLSVFQNAISRICIPEDLSRHMLPCKLQEEYAESINNAVNSQISYCARKNKVPLLSIEALHHLHIFIFVLAVVHVIFCVVTIFLSWTRTFEWRSWEEDIAKQNGYVSQILKSEVHHFHDSGEHSDSLGWLHSFVKLFCGSVTKFDYVTLRQAFIVTQCGNNRNYNFHRCMTRVLESDFKKVVCISWYLWLFVVIFLLLNVHGWLTSFWMSFIPLILLLAVGTKLAHKMTLLAPKKNSTKEDESVGVKDLPDECFPLRQPWIVLFLIHFILFENTFEFAFFFWIWVQYSFDSCIMGGERYVIVRLIIGVFIQVYCSWRTLPLCAIVTQIGENPWSKEILSEHVQEALRAWLERVRSKRLREASNCFGQDRKLRGLLIRGLGYQQESCQRRVNYEGESC